MHVAKAHYPKIFQESAYSCVWRNIRQDKTSKNKCTGACLRRRWISWEHKIRHGWGIKLKNSMLFKHLFYSNGCFTLGCTQIRSTAASSESQRMKMFISTGFTQHHNVSTGNYFSLKTQSFFQLFAPPRTCEFVTSKVNFLKMNPRKASEDREKWLEGGGREAGGGESDDDLGDKVPQFYIYKLPIVRFSGCYW